jgi:hypothetical protein
VLAAPTHATTPGAAPPAAVQALLPGLQPAGTARLTVWGFPVYEARLWVTPGFTPERYAEHGFALELHYLRDFRNEDIAQRSISEMRRIAPLTEAQSARWLASLRGAFPDVRTGDRIVGIHRPGGEGAQVQFLTNGRLTGSLRDADFARRFFGIWLSERTSEPALRQALVQGVPP